MMALKIFEKIVQDFMEHLKEINQKRNILEQQLYDANRNEQLLQLLRIQKSLVYFVTALRSNELLFMKLERTNFLGLNEAEKEILEDLIIDTSQALGDGQYLHQHPEQHIGCLCKHYCQQPKPCFKKTGRHYHCTYFSSVDCQFVWNECTQRF